MTLCRSNYVLIASLLGRLDGVEALVRMTRRMCTSGRQPQDYDSHMFGVREWLYRLCKDAEQCTIDANAAGW